MLPQHVALIMDGNGRWASRQGLPRSIGHRAGAEQLREIIKTAVNLGIPYITVFVFSTENWKRGDKEVSKLKRLFHKYMLSEQQLLEQYEVKVRFIGEQTNLDLSLIEDMRNLEKNTANNNRLVLTLALNYGARKEIAEITKKIALMVSNGDLAIDDITEDQISKFSYTADLPDPDLIIRTSGEKRMSNFLLWQSAYSELYFVDTLWPDFTTEDFCEAVQGFSSRGRRFGALT